jgi:hypothetical protein
LLGQNSFFSFETVGIINNLFISNKIDVNFARNRCSKCPCDYLKP